jgi:xanthine dehydrogenase YagS FAD-binding subunit
MQPLRHVNAKTIDEAVSTAHKKSMMIAGGTDCLSMLKNRILPMHPEVLLNIKTISGLEYINEDGNGLNVGALTKLSDIAESPIVRERYGILADAAQSVASPQIRNMGTLGGNLCQNTRCWYYRCSPFTGRSYICFRKGGRECFAVAGDNRYHAILGGKRCFAVCPSDTAVALSALDATIRIQGPAGKRAVSIHDFFTAMGNVLKSHEIVTDIQIPAPVNGAKQIFIKFRLRKAIDFAIVSVASIIDCGDGGRCRDARIALGAVAPAPIRATHAEESIKGKIINIATAVEAAQAAVTGAMPLSMNAYKVEIAKTLVKRCILASNA